MSIIIRLYENNMKETLQLYYRTKSLTVHTQTILARGTSNKMKDIQNK